MSTEDEDQVITLNVLDALTRRTLPTRVNDPIAVIIHATGETDHDKILKWYRSEKGLSPHWYIDKAGIAHHIVDENKIAYHTAIFEYEANAYRQGFESWSKWTVKDDEITKVTESANKLAYRQWKERWPGLDSPLDLPMCTTAKPNHLSIGIELQSPHAPFPGFIFGDAQYEACRQLVWLISRRWGIKRDKMHIVGHSDCSPMRRWNRYGMSDPGWGFDFDRIIDSGRKD